METTPNQIEEMLKAEIAKAMQTKQAKKVDEYSSTKDVNLDDTFLNKKLVDYVFDGMPKNYSLIEKAVYCYIKLCKTLTYDPEFYANNQTGMIARKHQDISNLSKITPENNQIVCYEFTQIYAKFLNMLGINYKITSKIGLSTYGASHNQLSFKADGFVVDADSVTSILSGDLFNAKINRHLDGLKCKNTDELEADKFISLCTNVYKNLKKQEKFKKTNEDSFAEFVGILKALANFQKVEKEEKLQIIDKQMQNNTLPLMEKINYLLRLSKNVFAEEYASEQFDVSIISKKSFENFKLKTLPTMVFSFNDESFDEKPENTSYMILNDNGKLENIYKETLKQNFDCGAFKHITAGVKIKHLIPGIDDVEVEDVR